MTFMPSLKDINLIIMTEIFFEGKVFSEDSGYVLISLLNIWVSLPFGGSLFFLFLTLSFKVIVNSQELQIMRQELSCTLHTHALMLVSCLIIV